MMTMTYFLAFFFLATLVLVCIKANGLTWYLFGMASGMILAIGIVWLLFLALGGGSQ